MCLKFLKRTSTIHIGVDFRQISLRTEPHIIIYEVAKMLGIRKSYIPSAQFDQKTFNGMCIWVIQCRLSKLKYEKRSIRIKTYFDGLIEKGTIRGARWSFFE